MALPLVIVLIVLLFTLFTYFICCYKTDAEKDANSFNRNPRPSYDQVTSYPVASTSSYRTPRPNNIGFTVSGEAGPIIPPVGAAPTGVFHQAPYPLSNVTPYPTSDVMPQPSNANSSYPPARAPYPIDAIDSYPPVGLAPHRKSSPSAPVAEYSASPPSYYEATGKLPSSNK